MKPSDGRAFAWYEIAFLFFALVRIGDHSERGNATSWILPCTVRESKGECSGATPYRNTNYEKLSSYNPIQSVTM